MYVWVGIKIDAQALEAYANMHILTYTHRHRFRELATYDRRHFGLRPSATEGWATQFAPYMPNQQPAKVLVSHKTRVLEEGTSPPRASYRIPEFITEAVLHPAFVVNPSSSIAIGDHLLGALKRSLSRSSMIMSTQTHGEDSSGVTVSRVGGHVKKHSPEAGDRWRK